MKTSRDLCHEIANALTIAHGMNRTYLNHHLSSEKTEGAPSLRDKLEKIEKAVAALERAEKILTQLRTEIRK